MILPGDLLNKRYEVLRDIGKGGFGRVWLAHDRLLDRPVALKALTEKDDGAERLDKRRARAELEARTLARLGHPAIVPIHDLVYHGRDKDPWIVMGYFDGQSLDKVLIPGRPMSEDDVISIAQPVLGGLMAAHAKGIIHRDIKPGNILRADDGSVLLIDFGIAKAMDASTFTSDGLRFGSLPYMAPEQLNGKPPAPPADIWSLGAVLHQALEGTVSSPFYRDSGFQSTMKAIFDLHPSLPGRGGPLGEIVLAMLRKDPGSRPTGPEVAKALREAQSTSVYPSHRDRNGGGWPGGGWPDPGATVPNPPSRLERMPLDEAAAQVSEASVSQGVEMLCQVPEGHAAGILSKCENRVAGELIAGIAVREPRQAMTILGAFDAYRAGRILDNMDRQAVASVLALPDFNPAPVLRGAHKLTGSRSITAMVPHDAARVIAGIDEDLAAELLARVTPAKVADILRHVSTKVRTSLMKRFSPDFRALVQRYLAQGRR